MAELLAKDGHVMKRIAVIGLGKLGAPLLAVLADSGYRVIGVDCDSVIADAMRAHRTVVAEPGLREILSHPEVQIDATEDIQSAIAGSDVSFVVVPTPSTVDGRFAADAVVLAVEKIGKALRPLVSRHTVSIVSTLMPGDMDKKVRPALEQSSGRKLGDGLGLCYNPAFVALGNVVAGFRQPDMVLIGESDARAGDDLREIYGRLCHNQPTIQRMSLLNAELTKLAINCFITTKISYANMLSEICGQLPGADAALVSAAVGCDSRIGSKYIQPALGYGGPCFPRDNAALTAFARELGASADFAEAADRVNRRQAARVVAMVRDTIASGTVAVLGLSYKPGTHVTEESQGIAIAEGLARAGYRVLVSDPAALDAAMCVLGDRAEAVADPDACVAAADLPSLRHLGLNSMPFQLPPFDVFPAG